MIKQYGNKGKAKNGQLGLVLEPLHQKTKYHVLSVKTLIKALTMHSIARGDFSGQFFRIFEIIIFLLYCCYT